MLDIVFDYKIEDLALEKEEVREAIKYQKNSGMMRLPLTKAMKKGRR